MRLHKYTTTSTKHAAVALLQAPRRQHKSQSGGRINAPRRASRPLVDTHRTAGLAAMAVRQLRPYEAILSTLGVGLFIEVFGPVTPDAIRSAYRAAAREHPVLRMAIAPKEAGSPEFVDRPELEVPLESEAVADLGNFDWEDRMHRVVNAPRDHTASPVYMEHVWEHGSLGGRHFLFAVMNHAAMDGPGIFSVFNAFCRQLGAIVSGNELKDPKPRELLDIQARVPEAPNGYARPEVPDNLLPLLPHEAPDGCRDEQYIHCIYKELDVESTERLLQNCRSHSCTVQGAVTASGMVAAAKAMRKEHPLPQVLGVLAPMNMRSQVEPPIDASDCVSANTTLWWTQSLAADQELFNVAEIATKSLRERIDEGFGFKWWHWIQAEMWSPAGSICSTSIGINPIQTQHGDLSVERVHLSTGQYGAKGIWEETRTIAWVHTFGGRLCMTVGYNWPGVSHVTGRALAETQWECLRAMAEGGPEGATVGSIMK
eukprot:evm.model.scf_2908.1 EVM.evm.TU.scf_2908.1   scf_2908:6001-17580(+)